MAQVEGGVVNDMQDAPANWDRPSLHLSCAVQISFAKGREDLARLCPRFFQKPTKFRSVGGLGGEFSVTVPGGRSPAHHFRNPEMFRASDMGGQDSQGVGGMILDTLDGTPIQSLRRQVGNQVADLAAQVFNSLQVVL
jgi:hypothetical protein